METLELNLLYKGYKEAHAFLSFLFSIFNLHREKGADETKFFYTKFKK